MNSMQTLGICMSISLATSLVLLKSLSQPLRAFIGSLCSDATSTEFWLRFTIVMLFLVPLLSTLSFGTPRAYMAESFDGGELIRRAVTATLTGEFFAVIGMGFWISSLARRAAAAARPDSQKTPGY